jgi:hypothetical protein
MNNLLVAGDALDDCLEEAEKPKDSTIDYSANRFQKNVSGKVFQRAVLKVSKFQKQIFLFSFAPKNERNTVVLTSY